MPPLVRGIVFAILGALVVFKLVRAARSGEISSRGFTFASATSPLWFTFGVGCYVLILMFCLAEMLSAIGLMTDPVITVKAYFKGT